MRSPGSMLTERRLGHIGALGIELDPPQVGIAHRTEHRGRPLPAHAATACPQSPVPPDRRHRSRPAAPGRGTSARGRSPTDPAVRGCARRRPPHRRTTAASVSCIGLAMSLLPQGRRRRPHGPCLAVTTNDGTEPATVPGLPDRGRRSTSRMSSLTFCGTADRHDPAMPGLRRHRDRSRAQRAHRRLAVMGSGRPAGALPGRRTSSPGAWPRRPS